MKILSVSHLYVVCVLMLGLFVAWGATMPQLTTGEQRGGCPACSDAPDVDCAALEGEVCNSSCTTCNDAGDKKCITQATHCTCADPYDGCANVRWNQWCS